MKEITDLTKFVRREFRNRAKPKVSTLEDEIRNVITFSSEVKIGSIVLNELREETEIKTEIQKNSIIEDNIIYFSEHKKSKYKLAIYNPSL